MTDDLYSGSYVRLGIRLYSDELIYAFHEFEDDREKWHIILVKEGATCYSSKDADMIDARGIIILPPPLGLGKFICNEDVKGYMLSIPMHTAMDMSFSNDMALCTTVMQSPYTPLEDKDMNIMDKFFMLIRHITDEAEYPYGEGELMSLCQALVATCKKYYKLSLSSERSPKQDEIINNFIKLVMANSSRVRKLDFYAQKLNISSKYLSTLVSNRTGKLASKWIEDHTIIAAKEYLRLSNLPVTVISEKMAFYSVSDFSKYFKHATGISPKEYRKHMMETSSLAQSTYCGN